jgi:hypothetical protein
MKYKVCFILFVVQAIWLQKSRTQTSGASAGSVLLGVLVQMDGSLPVELDGAHGGNGGTGGRGPSGASGALGNTGSGSLFDCRRGHGGGDRGLPGGSGGLGGAGGRRQSPGL